MTFDWLDIVTTILGLVYIYLEYKASIWLWIVGIVMPAMDVFLYWRHGLYGDAGMAVYYTLAAIYGYIGAANSSIKKNKNCPLRTCLASIICPLSCFSP